MIGITCYENQIANLDLTKCTNLETLYCFRNKLTKLDTSKNPKLRALQLYGNYVTSIDVSNNILLEELYCNGNELKSLDVTKNTKLKTLYCFINHFSSLDLSNNTLLSIIGLSTQSISVVVIEKDGKQYIDMSGFNIDGNKVTNVSNGKWNASTKQIELSTKVSKGGKITYDYITGNANNLMQVEATISKVEVVVIPTTKPPTTKPPTTEETTTKPSTIEKPTEEITTESSTIEKPTEEITTESLTTEKPTEEIITESSTTEKPTEEITVTDNDDSTGRMPGWFIGLIIGIVALILLSGIMVIIFFIKRKRDKEDEH